MAERPRYKLLEKQDKTKQTELWEEEVQEGVGRGLKMLAKVLSQGTHSPTEDQ